MSPDISETVTSTVELAPTYTNLAGQQHYGLIYGFPDDEPVANNGVPDILGVTSALESAGFTCCIVGTSALIYFGARRGRGDWQICVPTELLDAASYFLQSSQFSNHYILSPPPPGTGIRSLLHTFPRFKLNGFKLWFQIIPSEDCHIEVNPSNIERSKHGLPYPKLEVYAQSLLDTYDKVDLCDLVDGMNLSKEWGEEHLKLSGTVDVQWAMAKNRRIRMSIPDDDGAAFCELSLREMPRRQFWEEVTAGKVRRIPLGQRKEDYATRFRLIKHADEDPRYAEHRVV